MHIDPLSHAWKQFMSKNGLAGVDTGVRCTNPRCCGVSLWKVIPRRQDGVIAGFSGQCALCGQEMDLPVVYLRVPAPNLHPVEVHV